MCATCTRRLRTTVLKTESAFLHHSCIVVLLHHTSKKLLFLILALFSFYMGQWMKSPISPLLPQSFLFSFLPPVPSFLAVFYCLIEPSYFQLSHRSLSLYIFADYFTALTVSLPQVFTLLFYNNALECGFCFSSISFYVFPRINASSFS
jgi:hypothetical protein